MAVIGTTPDGYNEVRCSDLVAVRPVVFLAFGQSIASNFNQTLYTPTHNAYTIDQGRCYEARDPMRGAESTRGSMWSFVADTLPVGTMPYTAFVTIGVGGSSIAQWDVGGSLNARLTSAIQATRNAGFEFSYVLWHQGSADRGSTIDAYQSRFRSMIRSVGPYGLLAGTAPGQTKVLIAVHTRCNSEQDMTLATAQRGLVDPPNGFFAGADTDTLGVSVRFDGCHLATSGQTMAADLWRERIAEAASYPPSP